MAKPKNKAKKILFAIEIIVIVLLIGGMWVYGQVSSRLDKINTPELDESKIKVNDEVQDAIDSEETSLTGYTTYALFGLDTRSTNSNYSGNMNSDTMIIASVNNDTKEVKLVSVYRDTLLNLGDDTYSKANAAYAKGGAEQAITMLNTNLDLNITEYATVDFSALATIVDDLDGIDIELSYAELVHMNNYCVETSESTGKDYTPIELPERPDDIEEIQYPCHLNGVQATSYCRIRYTASLDMGRTERQRKVIQLLVDKAKKAGLSKIFTIMDDVFPMITTSMDKDDILQLLPTLIGYSIMDTTGFPSSFKFSNVNGSVIVPTDLESNVIELHKWLYGDEDYTPSETVKTNSAKILEIVGGTSSLDDTQTTTSDTNTTTSYVWGSDGSVVSQAEDTYDSSYSYSDSSSSSDSSGSSDYSGGSSDSSGSSDYSGGSSDSSGSSDYSGGGDTDYSGGDDTDYSGGDTDYSGGDDTDYSGGDTDYSGGDDGGSEEDVAVE